MCYTGKLLQSAAALICLVSSVSNAHLGVYAAEYRRSDFEAAVKRLKESDQYQRKSAAYRLGEMGAEAQDALEPLIEILQSDEHDDVCGEVSNTLGKIGTGAEPAVPALIAFLQSKRSPIERCYAAAALGHIGRKPEVAVPALIGLLKSDDPQLAGSSARALGDFHENGRPAIPDLVECIRKSEKDMRDAAAAGLSQIPCSQKDLALVIELFEDDIDVVRQSAAQSISGAGPEAAAAVPALIRLLLDDRDYRVRHAAALALGAMGSSAKAALPALTKALSDNYVSGAAGAAISKIKAKRK